MTGLSRGTAAVLFGLSVVAPNASPRSSPAQTSQTSATASLNDASAAGIFDALNQWDIDMGAMVADRGSRKDIRAFAAQLVRDHHAIQKLDQGVVKKLKLKLVLPKGLAIQQTHDAGTKKLKSLKGKEFDLAFLQHEVEFHKAAIDLIANTLLPAVQNADLKALMAKSSPAFQAHLVKAQSLLGED